MSTTKDAEAVIVPEMEKRLHRLEREFEQMMRKAESAEVSVRSRVLANRRDFEHKRESLKSKLAEVKSASASARDELSTGVSAAWNELSDAFNKARNELMSTH